MDSEKAYYLGDSEWLDNPRNFMGISIVTGGVDIVKNVMTPGFMCAYTTLFADFSVWS